MVLLIIAVDTIPLYRLTVIHILRGSSLADWGQWDIQAYTKGHSCLGPKLPSNPKQVILEKEGGNRTLRVTCLAQLSGSLEKQI